MDYIPSKRSDQYLWLKNISTNAVTTAADLSVPAAEGTDLKGHADAVVAAMDATNAASTALDGARATERTVTAARLKSIRDIVKRWKTQPAYPGSGAEGVLQLKGPGDGFDPSTFKAEISAVVEGGVIRIEFKKSGLDGVNVYCRLRGSPGWQKLAFDSSSPYIDNAPLANPAVPETREYKARGVLDDEEVGLESDVVSVVFGG